MKRVTLLLSIVSINLVGGCASRIDEMVDMPDTPISEIYYSASSSGSETQLFDERSLLRQPMTQEDHDLSPYVRSEKTALDTRFPKLPNPELVMFVAPHLSTRDDVPVPGYVTTFEMYSENHYALPGEQTANIGATR